MHPGVRTEVQEGEFFTGFWQQPHAIDPKTADQAQVWIKKVNVCLSSVRFKRKFS